MHLFVVVIADHKAEDDFMMMFKLKKLSKDTTCSALGYLAAASKGLVEMTPLTYTDDYMTTAHSRKSRKEVFSLANTQLYNIGF